jgi:hypothetical protein
MFEAARLTYQTTNKVVRDTSKFCKKPIKHIWSLPPSSNHSTLISCENDFHKTLPYMLEFSYLLQVLDLVGRTQSIFFMRVRDFPYMKGLSFSMYLDCWGLTRSCKILWNQHSRQLQYQKPWIVRVCCCWHLTSQISPKEINQWISLEKLNKTTGVVGGESTTRIYSMKFTFTTSIVCCPHNKKTSN